MINLAYNGKNFNQREDGFVNLGQLCATHGKKFANWSRTQGAQEYLTALAEALTESESHFYTPDKLVISEVDAIGGNAGTWGHPLVAIEVARWISPVFGVWCNQHIKTLIETGNTKIEEVELPKPISHTAVEYAHAAVAVESLPNNLLKQLVRDALIDELSLQQNIKALPVAEKPKRYTIVKVRAKELGYTPQQISDGTALGKFVKAQVSPAFQEYIGKYPVFHYEINDQFDKAIHLFFS